MSNSQQTTGREPSLSHSETQTTGMEPGLSTGYALDNLNAIRLTSGAARLGNKSALKTLLNTLRYGADFQREMAAQMLGAIDNDQVGKALLFALHDTFPLVRAASVQSLGRIGRAAYLPSLVPLLGDDYFGVRMMVARAMTNIFLKNENDAQLSLHVVRHLDYLLRDDSPEVRETACAMLGWIGTAEARSCLRLATHDPLTSEAALLGLMWAGRDAEERSQADNELPFRTVHQNRLVAAVTVAKTLVPSPDQWERQLFLASVITVMTLALSLVVRYLTTTDNVIPGLISIMMLAIAPIVSDFAVERWIHSYREDERIVALKQMPASRAVLKWGYTLANLYRIRFVMAFVLGIVPTATVLVQDVWLAILAGLTIGIAFLAIMVHTALVKVNSIVIQKADKQPSIFWFEDLPEFLSILFTGAGWVMLLLFPMMGQFLFMVPVIVVLIGRTVVEFYRTRDEA